MFLDHPRSLPGLAQLRAFDCVAAIGAMAGAAESLNVTQPAISRGIRLLERELDVSLVVRRSDGSYLTGEGEVLARRTIRFFSQVDAALEEAGAADRASVARLARKITHVQMRSLVAIASQRSFRSAAKMLGIAEPTLHRPARELERLLRIQLFRRTADGIGLSAKGTELARRFSLCMTEIASGIEELSLRRGAAQAAMTIGVLPLAPKRLPAMAADAIVRARPSARCVIREGGYDELVAGLRHGAVDVVFGALQPRPHFDDVHEERLFEDPYRIVCRRNHPLTRLPRVTLAALRSYDWVFATSDLPRRAMLDELVKSWKLSTRVQLETNSPDALIAILCGSDRISLLPRTYVAGHHSDRLAVLDKQVPHVARVVGLTTRRDWLPTPLQAELLAELRRAAGDGGHFA
jgi:LysR family transcriptional regulator of gallate degradation